MKKKIAFFTKNLDIGGIERAIINYVNNIDKEKYEIYLFLDKAEGIYLDQVNREVKIINLNISDHKNPLIRKIKNAYKLLYYSLKYYHKFYFAASFATYLKSGSIYWFSSPYAFSDKNAYEYIVTSQGFLYNSLMNNIFGVRPALSLRTDVVYSEGDGSKDSPYIIETN